MLNNFIYAKYKDLVEDQLNLGNIPEDAIVFIEDSKEIWNHGVFYGAADFELSKRSSLAIQNKVVTKEFIKVWNCTLDESFNADFGEDFAVNLLND